MQDKPWKDMYNYQTKYMDWNKSEQFADEYNTRYLVVKDDKVMYSGKSFVLYLYHNAMARMFGKSWGVFYK